ncbi:hypothetical protein CKO20_12685 [Rhodocyclus tenuis]|nr:hypothetical protein [Rhodocyclus tenuis]
MRESGTARLHGQRFAKPPRWPSIRARVVPAAMHRGHSMCQCLLACVLLGFGALFHSATVSAEQPPRLYFDAVASLSGEAPLAFLQDRQGFIWLAGSTGVFRHDGYRSVLYQNDASVPGSLPDDWVTALFEDRDGHVWAATHNGIARFDKQTGRFSRLAPPPDADGSRQNLLTKAIVGDGGGGLWLATRGGLWHFDLETSEFRAYRHDESRPDSLGSDNVSVLARDARGGLWVGNWPTGLSYLANGSKTFRHYQLDSDTDAKRNPSNPRALLFDSRQRLWVGTDTSVFLWHDGTPWAERRRVSLPSERAEVRVYNIYEDPFGQVWVCSDVGLLRWDETRQKLLAYSHQVGDAHSLPANIVSTVLVDRSRTLWVGTNGAGVSRSDLADHGIEQIKPEIIAPENFKAWNFVSSFAEDGQGNIWLGGSGGLALVNLAERKLLRSIQNRPGLDTGLGSNKIQHLYQQPGGPLWIATGNGLGRLDPVSGRLQTRYFAGAGNNSINAIAPGRDGVLWLATAGGLIRYSISSGATQYFSHDPMHPGSLGPGANSCVLEDRAGNLWVGGGYQAGARGLYLLRAGSRDFVHLRHNSGDSSSLRSDIVSSIREDVHGDIWLGTSAGLSRANWAPDGTVRFERFEPHARVVSVLTDLANNIWTRNAKGLSRLDPVRGETASFTIFRGMSEGLRDEGANFRGKDGTLYFGSLHGVTVVRPDEVRQNTIPPQIAITNISVFNKSLLEWPESEDIKLAGSVTEPQHLQLSWKSSVFSLEFSALHFADPARNRFVYRLDGFDKDWQETSADNRVASYTNLDPGEYVFRVKAANSNGIWSENEIRLPITITPPFWSTNLFRVALLLLALLLVVFLYRWRVRQLTADQAHLEALVEERTRQLVDKERAKTRFLASASHDLRQPIQAITLFIGALRHGGLQEGQSSLVGRLEAAVEALRGLLDALLDVSKLDAGVITPLCAPFSLHRLMEEITLDLSPLALDKGLRFKLFCPQREIMLNSDPQLLKMVLRNLIANAINYTERGGLLFAARLRQGKVCIQVWDTGIGISDSERGRIFEEFYQVANPQRDRAKGLGLGLSIVKRILALLKLPIVCRSRLGRGTLFEIVAPVGNSFELPAPGCTPPAKIDLASFAGKTFVVVEDDLLAANGLLCSLQAIGAEVIAYPSAEIALADRDRVYEGDYYVSDFRLPGSVSGIDFLNDIRMRRAAPCVLVTGDTSTGFIEAAHRSGLPVLFKPVALEQLLTSLSG